MFKAGWQPLEPYKNQRHKWKSKCMKCNRISYPTLKMVKAVNSGCAYCAGIRIDDYEAVEIMIKAELKPLEPYKDSKTKWKSKCLKCGTLVAPRFNSIQRGQGGCKKCGVQRATDMSRTKHAEAEAQVLKKNLKPLEQYVSRNNPWKCECLVCGSVVTTALKRIQHGNGCRVCAVSGFKPTEPAILYLIFHPIHNSIKIGVTNTTSNEQRLVIHKKFGWETQYLFNFNIGEKAEKIEFALLKWLRKDLNLPIHLSADLMPQHGHTETVSADSITVFEIQKKIEELKKGLQE
jgi:hypothetical protein